MQGSLYGDHINFPSSSLNDLTWPAGAPGAAALCLAVGVLAADVAGARVERAPAVRVALVLRRARAVGAPVAVVALSVDAARARVKARVQRAPVDAVALVAGPATRNVTGRFGSQTLQTVIISDRLNILLHTNFPKGAV